MNQYLDKAPCLYFELLDSGCIVQINETMCLELGFSRDELIGQHVDLILPSGRKPFQELIFLPLLKLKGHAEELYLYLKKKNGDILCLFLNAIRNENLRALSQYVGIKLAVKPSLSL